MKVSRLQSPRSKVQSRTGKSRSFFNLGRWALDFGLPPSRLGGRKGIALVITLIMLSIITFMAVTFLVLSQRERSSVSTATDQKIARDASDTAFSRVSAELLTRMITHTKKHKKAHTKKHTHKKPEKQKKKHDELHQFRWPEPRFSSTAESDQR